MKKILLIVFCYFVMVNAYADKIAVIGGGAAGMVTTWLLEETHDVTLYEAHDKLGGHAETLEINVDGTRVPFEAGAEFFNELYYPNFLKLLRYYKIPIKNFTLVTTFFTTDNQDITILPPFHDGTIELRSLTPRNIARALQFKTVIDHARKLLETQHTKLTVKEFIDSLFLTNEFKYSFFYPYLASGWGVLPDVIQTFSAFNTIKYLIEGYDAKDFQWYEIPGGLKQYIDALKKSLTRAQICLNTPIKDIQYVNGKYIIFTQEGASEQYDQVVLATAANAASELLKNSPETASISALLGKIKYYNSKIAIHGDPHFMPKYKEDWRIANVSYDGDHSALTIYKPWKSKTPVFKTWVTFDMLNQGYAHTLHPNKVYALLHYKHPIIDGTYFEVQDAIKLLQGNKKLWFAGLWTFDNDSHESAVTSAIKIGEALAPNSKRLQVFK